MNKFETVGIKCWLRWQWSELNKDSFSTTHTGGCYSTSTTQTNFGWGLGEYLGFEARSDEVDSSAIENLKGKKMHQETCKVSLHK